MRCWLGLACSAALGAAWAAEPPDASAVAAAEVRPAEGQALPAPPPAHAAASAALPAPLAASAPPPAPRLSGPLPSPVPGLPAVADPNLRWVVGAQLQFKPSYEGGASNRWALTPRWALRVGRWRIGTGGVGQLLPSAADAGSGASTDLYRGPRLAMSLGLRMDSGRSSGDDAALAGLADVKRTLRARVAGSWQLGGQWAIGGNVSEDVLGRGGGMSADLGIGRSGRWSDSTTWGAGVSLSAGNATYFRARYGVPLAAQRADRPAFEPGAGWHSVSVSGNATRLLNERWALLGSVGATRLLGPALASPLTHRATSVGASVGLVWLGWR